MRYRCLPLLAVLFAAPAFAQSEQPTPDTTATVPHWPEHFGLSDLLNPSPIRPFAERVRPAVPFAPADSVIAVRTSPEARAEAAIVDPEIVVAPDSTVDARMRLLVPPAHADEEMMRDPGPVRSPAPEAAGERPVGQR